MESSLIIFVSSLLALILFYFIKFLKNLNLKVCISCKKSLDFKYFIFGKICIKHCISCTKNFIRKTQRTKRN